MSMAWFFFVHSHKNFNYDVMIILTGQLYSLFPLQLPQDSQLESVYNAVGVAWVGLEELG